jgi:SWI/SNF related-matrix-associated actin-dependent regulator of chromatin subfamily C
LEQWGLINYQVDNDAKAAPLGPPCTSHFTILADTPSGLAPITSSRPTVGSLAGKQIADIGSVSSKKRDENEQIKVNSCLENVGLRTDQYLKKANNKSGMRTREWSDQEILLLLEGLEIFKDDWNKVCEHVGTRTQDECILKFLQLPIEDPYLEGTNNSALGPLSYQPIPFSQSGNPIMSTVAFLASVVDPRIASAAAKAAITEFSKMKDEVPPQVMDSHLTNISQMVKEGKKIDSNYNIEQTGIAIINSDNNSGASSSSSSSSLIVETTAAEISKDSNKMEIDTQISNEKFIIENSSTSSIENQINGNESENSVIKVESTTTTTTTTTTTISSQQKDNNVNENEIKSAAASALAAAAVKAKHLSIIEEKKIKSAVAQLVETQLKKLEIKLRHFEELEALMDRERETLEYQRQQLLQERQQFYLEQLKAAELKQKEMAFQQLKIEGKLAQPSQTIIIKQHQQQAPPQPQIVVPVVATQSHEIVHSTPSNDEHSLQNSNIQPTTQVQTTVNMNQTHTHVITQNPPSQPQPLPQSQPVVVMSMPQQTIIQQMPLQYQQPTTVQQQQPIINNLETGKNLNY